jgi:hypothetical protein
MLYAFRTAYMKATLPKKHTFISGGNPCWVLNRYCSSGTNEGHICTRCATRYYNVYISIGSGLPPSTSTPGDQLSIEYPQLPFSFTFTFFSLLLFLFSHYQELECIPMHLCHTLKFPNFRMWIEKIIQQWFSHNFKILSTFIFFTGNIV